MSNIEYTGNRILDKNLHAMLFEKTKTARGRAYYEITKLNDIRVFGFFTSNVRNLSDEAIEYLLTIMWRISRLPSESVLSETIINICEITEKKGFKQESIFALNRIGYSFSIEQIKNLLSLQDQKTWSAVVHIMDMEKSDHETLLLQQISNEVDENQIEKILKKIVESNSLKSIIAVQRILFHQSNRLQRIACYQLRSMLGNRNLDSEKYFKLKEIMDIEQMFLRLVSLLDESWHGDEGDRGRPIVWVLIAIYRLDADLRNRIQKVLLEQLDHPDNGWTASCVFDFLVKETEINHDELIQMAMRSKHYKVRAQAIGQLRQLQHHVAVRLTENIELNNDDEAELLKLVLAYLIKKENNPENEELEHDLDLVWQMKQNIVNKEFQRKKR